MMSFPTRFLPSRRRVVLTFLAIIIALVALRLYPHAPLTDSVPYSRAVYAREGELLRLTLADDEIFRLYTPLEDISPSLVRTTLFYEDRYFRYHPGVNPIALLRGFWTTYIAGSRPVGASTITMQLARAVYGIDSSHIPGKLQQIAAALWLEACYSKDDIIEAYINLAPYGHNIEGVGAASLIYFGKRSADLSLMEAMTLSVVPQNPVKRLPTSERGWQELKRNRDQLMQTWVQAFPEDTDKLAHFQLPMRINRIADLPYVAPHFVDGLLAESSDTNEYFSTLNIQRQQALERSLHTFISGRRHLGMTNAAALLVNTDTMQVEATVGSADFFDSQIEGQVDGTRAMRSPGSLMKPFIYALAIEQGLIHPHTLLADAPRRYGLYSPENADRGFLGPIFAQDALVHSRNIPAVDLMIKLERETDASPMLELLKKAGVAKLKSAEYYGAALALGGFEMTMEDAARIYASLNNDGKVYLLKKLISETETEPVSIITPEAAYIVRDMLQHNPPANIFGSRTRFNIPIAWKTGTSFSFRDGWAAAVFGKYVLVAWVGNFDNEGNPAFLARSSAAPLLFHMLTELLHEMNVPADTDAIPLHLNLKYVNICAATGELPLDYCPLLVETLFIPGVSPIKTSDIFRRIPIDIATGLRACAYEPETTRWEVYEFWPADIMELYEQAGVKKKTPPRYLPNCTLEETSVGLPPTILIPSSTVSYELANLAAQGGLPLVAAASTDVDSIYWFVDNAFVGEAENNKPLFLEVDDTKGTLSRGKHSLQAVDNLGRTSRIEFEVR
jgi:penicillin-binding protein 1C